MFDPDSLRPAIGAAIGAIVWKLAMDRWGKIDLGKAFMSLFRPRQNPAADSSPADQKAEPPGGNVR